MPQFKLVLGREIPADLRDILRYFEDISIELATRFSRAVRESMSEAASHPHRGSPKIFKSRRLSNIRSRQVIGFENYLILYEVKPESVRVLAITHGARQLSRLLKRRM